MTSQQARALTLIPRDWTPYEKLCVDFFTLEYMADLGLIAKRVTTLKHGMTKTEFRKKQ